MYLVLLANTFILITSVSNSGSYFYLSTMKFWSTINQNEIFTFTSTAAFSKLTSPIITYSISSKTVFSSSSGGGSSSSISRSTYTINTEEATLTKPSEFIRVAVTSLFNRKQLTVLVRVGRSVTIYW